MWGAARIPRVAPMPGDEGNNAVLRAHSVGAFKGKDVGKAAWQEQESAWPWSCLVGVPFCPQSLYESNVLLLPAGLFHRGPQTQPALHWDHGQGCGGVSERWEGEIGGAHTAPCRAALLAPDDGVTLSTPRGDHRRSQDGRDPYGSSSPTPACTEDLPKPQAVR